MNEFNMSSIKIAAGDRDLRRNPHHQQAHILMEETLNKYYMMNVKPKTCTRCQVETEL